jgi:peptide methionine sulfoxide reductase msrA/msrB
MKTIVLIIITLLLLSCSPDTMKEKTLDNEQIATFAGGCFWCIEGSIEDQDGVNKAISGYAGGTEENPTYQQVASGKTSHREAVQVYYNPDVVSYKELVTFFFWQIDPTQEDGQFVDRGFQYTTAVFYHNNEQKKIAKEVIAEMQKKFDKPIVTAVLPFTTFYEAEDYHQDYSKKRTVQYKIYEQGSGRPQFIKEKYGK